MFIERRKMPGSSANRRKEVSFEFDAEPGSKVCLVGSFNDWSIGRMLLKETGTPGCFKGGLLLHRGTYEYKFVINGVWAVDPACDDWIANDFGSINSVITVA
jgi:1,4-alpha-glucan branching enzyme